MAHSTEAAEYLRSTTDALYKRTAAAAVPHRKEGGRILFHRAELDEWLNDFREGPTLPSDRGRATLARLNGPAAL